MTPNNGDRQMELFSSLPPAPLRESLPHQLDAIAYAFPRSKIALFMEMRLGKSLVAVRWAQRRGAKKVLVVAPLSSLGPWEEELYKERIPRNQVHYLLGSKTKRLQTSKNKEGWFLVNYEGLRSCPEILKQNWKAVILDESTRIRNPKAQITRLLTNELFYVPNRCILSGLPNPESSMD